MRAKKFLDILFINNIDSYICKKDKKNKSIQATIRNNTHTHKKIILIELAFQNAFYEYEALNYIVCATYKNNDKSV